MEATRKGILSYVMLLLLLSYLEASETQVLLNGGLSSVTPGQLTSAVLPSRVTGKTVAPGTITVDGDPSDWFAAGIDELIVDPAGDFTPAGLDVLSLRVTDDGEGIPVQGSALRFDGSNDLVTCGTVAPLSQHTLEVWIKPTSSTGGVIVGHLAGPNQACTIGTELFGGADELCYNLSPAGCGTDNYICHQSDTLGVWTHMAGTFDGNTSRLYINGVLVNQQSGVSFQPSTWMTIGAITFFNGQQFPFAGEIDEIRIWNVPRTVQEIQDTMHRPLTGTEPGLVGYWKLDEDTGQEAHDTSPSGTTCVLGTTASPQSNDPVWVLSEAPIRQIEDNPPCPVCNITAGLMAGSAAGNPGSVITIPVEVRNAPNAVDALGFELVYDPTKLTFSGCDFTGTLLEAWDQKQCSTPTPGLVRVGAFTTGTPIAAGATGLAVKVAFEVIACEVGEQFALPLQDLVDDVATWDTCAGCVTCGCPCDGDVDASGQTTPGDALLAFQCFLEVRECNLCEQSHGDITTDDRLPPGDALCIFREFLDLPPTEDCPCFLEL